MRLTLTKWSASFLLGLVLACVPRKPATEAQEQQPVPADPHARPEFELSADALEQRIAELVGGYTATGTHAGELSAFKALELELVRGQCYVLAMRLQQGASFGPHARRGVAVITAYELEDMVVSNDSIVGPGVVLDAGCPLVDGHLVVDLQATWDKEQDTTRFHELGSGPYTWTVYTSEISEDELKSLKQAALGEDRANEAGAPPGAQTREIRFTNQCAKRVSLFVGKEPKSGRGDILSLTGGATFTKQLKLGDSVWLVDGNKNGMGIVNVTAEVRSITITSDCIGISGQ